MEKRHLLILSGIAIVILVLAFPTTLFSGQGSVDPVKDTTDYTGTQVEVVEVIDADTIDVRFNGRTETVRLLGIDAPEIHSPPSPDEWEGITDANCLRKHGNKATEYVRAVFETQGNVTLQFDSQSDRRGYYDRLLAYVLADGENVNRLLIDTGLARYYDSDFSRAERFQENELDARRKAAGAWGC